MFSLPRSLCFALTTLLVACTPGGTDTFTREEQTVALNFPMLTGTGRADLWSVAKVSVAGVDTDTLVHNRGGARWDALSLPELSLGQGGFVQGLASAGKNEVWVSSYKSNVGPGLWLVNGNGGIEDHTSEVPAEVASAQILELTFAGGTLFVAATANSAAPVGHLYRRNGTTLEPLPGLAPTIQFTVLAARGPDDLYLVQTLANFSGSKLIHYVAGVATEVPWASFQEGYPTLELATSGEVWLWKANGSNIDSFSGQHGDGTTFTPWTTQGWPVVTPEQQVTHRALGMISVGPSKLAMLVARSDAAAQKETERGSLGVNFLDAQGKVTVGPRLLQCLTPDECAVGQQGFRVLADGTVIVGAGSTNKVWFIGSTSSLQ